MNCLHALQIHLESIYYFSLLQLSSKQIIFHLNLWNNPPPDNLVLNLGCSNSFSAMLKSLFQYLNMLFLVTSWNTVGTCWGYPVLFSALLRALCTVWVYQPCPSCCSLWGQPYPQCQLECHLLLRQVVPDNWYIQFASQCLCPLIILCNNDHNLHISIMINKYPMLLLNLKLHRNKEHRQSVQ